MSYSTNLHDFHQKSFTWRLFSLEFWSSTNFIILGFLTLHSQYGSRSQSLLELNTDACEMGRLAFTRLSNKLCFFFSSTHIELRNSTSMKHSLWSIGQFAAQSDPTQCMTGVLPTSTRQSQALPEANQIEYLLSSTFPSINHCSNDLRSPTHHHLITNPKRGFSKADKNFSTWSHCFVESECIPSVCDGTNSGVNLSKPFFASDMPCSQCGAKGQTKEKDLQSQSIGPIKPGIKGQQHDRWKPTWSGILEDI